jgi:uncharacterized membrane protein
MLGTKTSTVKDSAVDAKQLATDLATDPKFRKKLRSALGHGAAANKRVRSRIGLAAAAARLAADEQLRNELRQMTRDLRDAWGRVERKRSHKFRNFLLLLVGGGVVAVAALPKTRQWLSSRLGAATGTGVMARVIDEAIEVDVPVSTAYNQWTQFEEFPKFMEGLDEVRQLDDTRLHWVANVGGKRAEWEAKILEQHPDKQVSWISEDGKKTRGTVSFESIGPSRTRVRLSMSYQAKGLTEAVGSAAGLDTRRVRGDLERFKQLIESRGSETGAWRGDISGGESSEHSAA